MKTKPCVVLPYPWHWVEPFNTQPVLYRLVSKPNTTYGYVAMTYNNGAPWCYPYTDRVRNGVEQLKRDWVNRETIEEAMLWVETMIATGAVDVRD